MKNKLLHNLGLKIMALLFAAIVWMIAGSFNDPLRDSTFYNVPVQLVNMGVLTRQEKTYEVLNNTGNVRITVMAASSVLEDLTRDNLVVRADCAQITADNTIPIEVSINDPVLENNIKSIQADKQFVQLDVEDFRSRQLTINVVKTGNLPEGYITGRTVTETNMMSISGPESALEKIRRAVVEVSMDNVTSDVEIIAQIRLLDEDGAEVTDSSIRKSIENVKVTVPVLFTKEVPLSYEISGTVAEGYALNGVSSVEPATILIAGKESDISAVEGIEIPASELDVTDASATVTETVDIRRYLPEGVTLAGNVFDGRVKLTAEVEAIRRRTLNIPTDAIQVLNIPEGWLGEILSGQNLQLVVSGLQADLNAITVEGITPHTNVASLRDENGVLPQGEQQIEILFVLPGTVRQEERVRAAIRLVQIQTDTQEENAGE